MRRDAPGEPARTALVAAVIDVGSNSVLLLTVALEPDRPARAIDEALATTRLGAGLCPGGALDPGAYDRTREAVAAFVARARAAGAWRTWAFATGAVRDATDGPEFVAELVALSGVPLEVLSGEEEARLAYAAVRAGLGLGHGELLVADVGGRTTELALGATDGVMAAASLPLGALSLAEAHGTALPRLAASAEIGLAASALPASARTRGARLAASGGTATALAALDLGLACHDPRRVHGHVLRRATLAALAAGLAAMPEEERRRLPGLDPGRAAILPAGAIVLDRVAEAVGASELVVSDHGVRHGYLAAALASEGVHADFRTLWP